MGSYTMILDKKKTRTILVDGQEKTLAVAAFYMRSDDQHYYFERYPNSARCRGMQKKFDNAFDYSMQLKADYLVFVQSDGEIDGHTAYSYSIGGVWNDDGYADQHDQHGVIRKVGKGKYILEKNFRPAPKFWTRGK